MEISCSPKTFLLLITCKCHVDLTFDRLTQKSHDPCPLNSLFMIVVIK